MLLTVLFIIGITAEAVTGALAAGRRKMDLFGVIIIATVTALGGGTVRDIILGHYPLVWVKQPDYIIIVAVAAIITTFTARFMRHLHKLFLILDAFGLVFFSLIGAKVAMEAGYPYFIVAISAVVTGVFGGVLRDIFCNTIPLVFQKELYASVAFVCAWLYILLMHTTINQQAVMLIVVVIGLLLRLLALRFKLGLPVFHHEQEN